VPCCQAYHSIRFGWQFLSVQRFGANANKPDPLPCIKYPEHSWQAVTRDVCVYKPDIDEKLPLVQRLAELVC